MKRLYLVALAAGLITSLPASLLAQQSTTTPAPAASPAPAPAASPAPAPAASPQPAASPEASAPPTDKGDKKTAAKKKPAKTTRQEVEHSIDSGTVPSRYRKYVPKEYQGDIPFDKR